MKRAHLAALLLAAVAAPAPAADPGPGAGAGETVIGISFRGAHRAYPLALFATRRVVNDVVGTQEVAVFHDPGSGTSAGWFRTVLGEPIEFSGDAVGAVADDLTTITRWDLTTGAAVAGSLAGQRLVAVPIVASTWEAWLAAHPNAERFAAPAP
ncbi:MAG: DUF3179 domain-containing protein [Acidobacteria bacterium]|nr:DUF3179 domain-containing protein [Acidobacteriota bacterium]